ncbi:N-substituted formamide deformylase precursor [Mycobacterium basiliense]|uniref:N-substituted formamide deformylase n=1 Tax=Mycobacterium basiliense TaxID=2094119 RepID=A0A447GAC6_9MYCO|nr:amidohydrolase [Mycobacterium basiliense]VDM87453.1 N-substituted formamide deformylase precursor [Mycobacterium basiliense]
MTGDADTIYVNGDIITMDVTVDEERPTAEAVAIKDGRIVAVGTRQNVAHHHRGPRTRVVDLHGRTLLPGFIDPHSHYINALTVANQVNLFAPPAGPCADVDAIVAQLKSFRDAHDIPAGELIIGYGYDETIMAGGRTLHREDLDKDFPCNPVLVRHVSLHGAVLNSAALDKFGISASTVTPPGGVIVRKEGSDEPDGLIMETAFLEIFASLPKPTREQEVQWSIAGQQLYAAAGITTAHEGLTHADDIAVLQRAAAGGANLIDIIAYPFILELDEVLQDNPPDTFGTYRNGVKLGGVKITLDGSPQGRTAFFTTPYLVDGPDGQHQWTGELPFPQDTVNSWFKRVYDLGVPLNVHANGDAAIDVLLAAHEYAAADDLAKDRHTTVIHSQFVRRDQLAKYADYKLIPSLFTEHAFYFGDTHVRLRGKKQAHFLSPMRAAIDLGLRPTNHTDFNVSPLDQMFVVWTAVNRVSRSGEVIGADQRVTALEALQAITINAAHQYREEQSKGSITEGKLADLVILDGNPLTVDPMRIKDIRVIETIKAGRTIYRRPAPPSWP